MAGGTTAPSTSNVVTYRGNRKIVKPTSETSRSVTYVANGTNSNQVISISKTDSDSSVKTSDPSSIEVSNPGRIPIIALFGYEGYSAEDTDVAVHYVHALLKPGETVQPPLLGIIPTANQLHVMDGTVVDFTAPSSTLYVDSSTTLGANLEDSETTVTVSDQDKWRVGDLLQVGINETTATRIEIMRITAMPGVTGSGAVTVERALYGTSLADKDAQTDGTNGAVSGAKIYYPTFNTEVSDYNRYGTIQTTADGKLSQPNMFGGIDRAATDVPQGIVPGSFCLKFYEPGYQNLTNDGNITSSTSSGLTKGRTFYLSVSIDGGTTDKITFTVDSGTNLFGGSSGIIALIQTEIDNLYSDESKNGYEKGASIALVNGDVRITSHQRLSTSAISVTTNADGTAGAHSGSGNEMFDGSNIMGRFPADIPSAVATRLPDDSVYDPITYASSPNTAEFCYDDGMGNITGNCTGKIFYETGMWYITGAPKSANFKYSVIHSSPFGGKRDSDVSGNRANQLVAIHANVLNKKINGEIKVKVF